MKFQLSFEAAFSFALLLFLYWLLTWKNKTNIKRKPPQPSGSWPVIGHLHLLGKLPHITLGNLADKYGPMFMVKLGFHQALVVSTQETARECLSTYDKVFINRPRNIFVEHLGYNGAMLGFHPYGSYWREMRKITILELLSNHRVEMLKHVRISEVRSGIKEIFDDYQAKRNSGAVPDTETVDMKRWFGDVNLNASVRIVAGKSLKESYKREEYDRCKQAFRDFFDLAGAFVPADALPFLRWLDIGGYEKTMKKVAIEIDHVAQGWLDDHRRNNSDGHVNRKQDFMDVMLDILKTGLHTPCEFEPDAIIKATCMAMILAGSDTTAVTLTWALSLLLNNRDALMKAQHELDTHVGKERQVNESDIKNLVYLQAILKETMRLYPALALSAPREAISDCSINGYHIPAGQSFELLPFGSGRRSCPGVSFALQNMQFTLANLLHGFEISTL